MEKKPLIPISARAIDASWTLFLDRDGVINKKLDGAYVTCIEEFHFLEDVPEVIAKLGELFGRILVVTNQQGIEKEIMTHEDLAKVHNHMAEVIGMSGGRIDEIYYCPHLAGMNSPSRKPNPGMAYAAKGDFPDINFKKSIMIGDSDSDIQFGNSLKMVTVRISNIKDENADYTYSSLKDFYLYLNIQ